MSTRVRGLGAMPGAPHHPEARRDRTEASNCAEALELQPDRSSLSTWLWGKSCMVSEPLSQRLVSAECDVSC